jgi:AraC-like DNA-binding protein
MACKEAVDDMLTETKELIALMPASDLLMLIEHSGYDVNEIPHLLARVGAPPTLFSDEGGFLDPALAWHLLSYIGFELNDECLGMLSHRVQVGSFELMIARALQEPTLGGAISAFADATNMLWPDVDVQLKRRLGELHFSMSCENPKLPRDAVQVFLEVECVTMFCIFQWLAEAELPVTRIRIAGTRPSDAIQFLAALNCPVQFEGNGVDVVFSSNITQLETTKRSVSGWVEDTFQILLNILQVRKQSFTSVELQASVKKALSSGIRQQSLIAASLAMSVATLRRKLAMEGVSFRQLSDQVFRESAGTLIASGESVEIIAAKMGYAEARSFRRAFQRVFDASPSEMRKEHGISTTEHTSFD